MWTFLWIYDSSGETLRRNIVNPKTLWNSWEKLPDERGMFHLYCRKKVTMYKPSVVKWVISNIMWCVASSCILHPVRGHKIIRKLLQDVYVLCYVTFSVLWNQKEILLSREATKSVIIQACSKSEEITASKNPLTTKGELAPGWI